MSLRQIGALEALAIAGLVGCGRSGYDNAVRLLTVESTTDVFWPGQAGVRATAVLVNELPRAVELHSCQLAHRADVLGAGFSAHPIALPETVAAGSTALLQFSVRLPAGAAGRGVLDASAELLDPGSGLSWRIDGATKPLLFDYASDDTPDLSRLPLLTVSTADDELDGGAALTSVAAAGGDGDLSLREALTILDNVGQPQRIVFDPAVFAPDHALPIQLGPLGALPTIRVAHSAIDGEANQVRIEHAPELAGAYDFGLLSVAASDVVLRQLELIARSYSAATIGAVAADRLLVSDCRINAYTDSGSWLALRSSPDATLRRVRGDIAGSNAYFEDCDGLLIDQSTFARGLAIVDSPGVVVLRSQVSSSALSLSNSPDGYLGGNTFTHYEAVAWSGSAIVVDGPSHRTQVVDSWIEGPRTHTDPTIPAILVRAAQQVTLSHNLVQDCAGEPIVLVDGANAGRAAPAIGTVTTTSVRGTSGAPDGSAVEVFAGDGDLARWVGATELRGGAFALDAVALQAGERVRAVLTDPDGNSSAASAAVGVP